MVPVQSSTNMEYKDVAEQHYIYVEDLRNIIHIHGWMMGAIVTNCFWRDGWAN